MFAELTNSGEILLTKLRKRVTDQTGKLSAAFNTNAAGANGTAGADRPNGHHAQPRRKENPNKVKLAALWAKGKAVYHKNRQDMSTLTSDVSELVNDAYAISKEIYATDVEPVRHEFYTLSVEAYALSKEAWEQGMVVLERVGEKRIKPILGDAQRDEQMREFAAEAQVQARNPAAQKVNRDFAIGTAALSVAIVGTLFYPPLHLLSIPGLLYSVRHMFKNSYQTLRDEGKVHVNTLSSITVVTCLLGQYYVAAAMTGFFYTFSQKLLLQVKNDSKQSLVNVFRQSSRVAWVLVDGVEVETPLEKVKRGDRVVINAGEVIPVDGIILQGFASVDQHMLTGEAQPVEKGLSDPVFAMTILLVGKIEVEVEQAGKETTAAQIGQLLNRTADFKTGVQLRSETLAQKTVWPTLILSAASVPLLGPMGAVAIITAHFGNRMSAISGIGILNYFRILSRYGVLVKDGRTLEQLQRVDTVVFDKTGTLTQEQPTLGPIHTCASYNENEVLALAAAAEYRQKHPIARAILHAAQDRQLPLPTIADAAYKVGYGLSVHIDGKLVRVGSLRFIEGEGIAIPAGVHQVQMDCNAQGHSLIIVAVDDELIGALELLPTVRPEAKRIIEGLRQRKIKSLVIISGDHEGPTRKLAQELGIDRYFAETLPQNKATIIEQLQAEGRTICYVGDGINDTIALKKAQVSVSLRGASTAATDTAQIILMDQSLQQLCHLFDLSQEFSSTLENSLSLILLPVALGIGGVYFVGLQVVQVLLLKQFFTLISLGNVMWPLRKYRGLLAQTSDQAAHDRG
jgi:heavy metal translocating P-type ATPase